MTTLPTLFVSHGSPMFAVEPGLAGPRLRALGQALPRPRAVLMVSPHWMTDQPRATATARPRTIHDFGGFPHALYAIQYRPPGTPELATRAVDLMRSAGWEAREETEHGLDHGAWVPLLHLYPAADIPVFQVSMPLWLEPESALALGRALAPLADEQVLIVGSGSLTHNLHEFRPGAPPEAYAREFAAWVRDAVASGDRDRLADTLALAPHARRAHPTAEHFLPLLVAAGAAGSPTPVTVIEGGVTDGVLAMDGFVFGSALELDTPPGRPGES